MITSMMGRMANAEKLSIPQLQQAIKNGTIPAYVGVPLLQEKMRQQQQMQMAAAQQQQGMAAERPPIAEEIMAQAGAMGGVDQLPSNLPIQNEEDDENYAGGGIIAFNDRGQVREPSALQIEQEEKRRFADANKFEKDWLASPEGQAALTESQQMSEPELSLPSSVLTQYWEKRLKNPDNAVRQTEHGMGIPKGSLARMDPNNDPRIIALRRDPAYLAFAENAAAEGRDSSLTAFLEAGNTPTPSSPSPSARSTQSQVDPETASDREAIKNQLRQAWAASQDIGSLGVRGLGTAADYFNRGLRAIGVPETIAPRVPGEYTFNRSSQGLTPYTDRLRAANVNEDIDSSMAFNLNRPAAPETASPNIDSQYIVQDTEGGGITPLRGASPAPSAGVVNAPGAGAPAQYGTAPSGAVSPSTARQISATNPGAPATLKDAERQAANGSPQASAAVSMLDKYVAMLEKSGDDVGRQKKEALYMALIQGGLGMMGGTSPNAFANISAGLLPATQAYQQAIAGIRKDDRQRLEKLMAAGISKEKLILEAEKLGIERTKATAMANYYNARAGAAGAGSSKEDRLADQFAEKTGLDYDRAAQVARRNMTTALANNSDYNSAKQRLAFAKNLKPAEKAALEKTVRDAEAPYLEDIAYNRSMAQRYLSRSSRGGGDAPVAGNMPKGIPQGSKQVGTSGGKPVYESPDGKRYIVE